MAKRAPAQSHPAFTVDIPKLDDARIEAIAEALLHLIDDDGRIVGMDAADWQPQPPGRPAAGNRPRKPRRQ
jgi:hypothetical protein